MKPKPAKYLIIAALFISIALIVGRAIG